EQAADPVIVTANWRKMALKYLEIYWPKIQNMSAVEFMKKLSWRLFCNAENRNWTRELLKMAREEYNKQKNINCRFTRPNYRHQ
ncbi:MAG: hypothetical protein ABIA63_03970, partial [bacterium]